MSRINSTATKSATLFFGCLLFHIIGTWSLPLIDRDEPRFAEASREMIERGDYIVPYFNNQLRLDKPPLTYWAQTLSYRVFGENDFAARFPSAIAAALTALVIFIWGTRLRGKELGWWAAIIFTLSLQTFIHAKAAVADMWLVLFVTLAHLSGWETLQHSRRNQEAPVSSPPWAIWRSPFLVFYLSLALGFLAKGPIAWTPLLTVGVLIIFTRDWQLVRSFKFLRGLLLTLAVIALWGIPALIETHGDFFRIGIGRHVIGRSLATMEGHGADSLGMYLLLLPFYFVTIFISFFPWSIKLPWLVQRLWKERRAGIADPSDSTNQIDAYLVTGTAVIFIIFTLIKTKLPHYTLPAFPLLALLLARHWLGDRLSHAHNASGAKSRSGFEKVAIGSACIWIAIAFVVPQIVARFFPAYQLFQQSRASLQANMHFASVEFDEPSLVWYFRSRVKGFLTPLNRRRAAEFMTVPGGRFVVLPMTVAGSVFANSPQSWESFTASGFNIAKGKRVDLTLVLKRE
jgi:4-amino-4-deoxy-L-arabinose transferase-like glycosyltransferase